MLNLLIGFENNHQDGTYPFFNWILSNGERSQQRDALNPTKFTHMLPAGSHNKIRSVRIHYYLDHIGGFKFLDKEGTLLWKIGLTNTWYLKEETVEIEEHEVIIGLACKLLSD